MDSSSLLFLPLSATPGDGRVEEPELTAIVVME